MSSDKKHLRLDVSMCKGIFSGELHFADFHGCGIIIGVRADPLIVLSIHFLQLKTTGHEKGDISLTVVCNRENCGFVKRLSNFGLPCLKLFFASFG